VEEGWIEYVMIEKLNLLKYGLLVADGVNTGIFSGPFPDV